MQYLSDRFGNGFPKEAVTSEVLMDDHDANGDGSSGVHKAFAARGETHLAAPPPPGRLAKRQPIPGP